MRLRGRLLCLTMLVACGDGAGPAPNPVPVLHAVSPATVVIGAGPTTVAISGNDFVSSARILADNIDRATTVHGTTSVSTQLEPNELTTPRVITLAVANPGPGGGTSGTIQFLVTLPPPVIGTVTPAQLMAGGPPVTLRIVGQRFRPSSVVRWNGNDRPTRFISDTEIDADLHTTDLLVATRARLAVANPALDGGTVEAEFPVYNPQPTITALSPASHMIGGPTFTLTVTGTHFVPGAVVTWDGLPRITTFVGPTELTAAIPAPDLAASDTVTIAVANPDPAIGTSNGKTFVVTAPILVDLHAWDLAWDSVRGRLYASVASDDARYPNEVVAIDPQTGSVVARVSAGLGPGQLAIADDASKLYVTLDGEAAVARIDLATFTRDLRFLVGTGSQGTQWAQDIEVMPGAPRTVAISRVQLVTSSHQDGVALYDDGVMRALTTSPREGGNLIEFASPTTLYGYNNETTSFYLYRMDVSDAGLTVRSATEGLVEEFWNDIRYGSGYLFSVGGTVVDATTGLLAATVDVQGLVSPEPTGGRVYYMTHTMLYAVSTTTWALIGAEPLPAGAPPSWYSVTRWGPDGFAYIGPTQVAIYRSDLSSR
jgi:trimeric autotransporter adhesin